MHVVFACEWLRFESRPNVSNRFQLLSPAKAKMWPETDSGTRDWSGFGLTNKSVLESRCSPVTHWMLRLPHLKRNSVKSVSLRWCNPHTQWLNVLAVLSGSLKLRFLKFGKMWKSLLWNKHYLSRVGWEKRNWKHWPVLIKGVVLV